MLERLFANMIYTALAFSLHTYGYYNLLLSMICSDFTLVSICSMYVLFVHHGLFKSFFFCTQHTWIHILPNTIYWCSFIDSVRHCTSKMVLIEKRFILCPVNNYNCAMRQYQFNDVKHKRWHGTCTNPNCTLVELPAKQASKWM